MKKIFLFFFITFSVIKSTTTPAFSDQTLINNSIDLIKQDQDLVKSINQAKNKLQFDKKEKNKVQQNINSYINPAVDQKVQEAFRNSNLSPLGKDEDQYNRVRTNVENQVNQYITSKGIKNSLNRDLHASENDLEKAMPFLGAGIMVHQLHEMGTAGEKEKKAKAEKNSKEAADAKNQEALNDKLDKISEQNKKIMEEQNRTKKLNLDKQNLNNKKNAALNAADEKREQKALSENNEYNSAGHPEEFNEEEI